MRAITLQPVAVFDSKAGSKIGKTIPAGTTFEYAEQSGVWLRRLDGTWVSCGSSFQYISIIDYSTTPPPPPPPPTPPSADNPVHNIRINHLGQISVDGLPYE
jgi:hypothetical protein